MNNYHIYVVVGKGKHSLVYKGRKKKTIEYFAIKSVEKSQRSKILHEVRMLHSLNHPNVLRFYSWYETTAHLWLVLEYCVGGDLMTLLKQDRQLPENSIHDLAFDLVKALQFLHSKGIIYCNLKPSNILLDEFGFAKLCDFGLARRLIDIEKNTIAALPQSKRGTPCYMAPELFHDGGIHSYASDLWALGCVLYECYTGRPPFTGTEFTQLVKSIISDPIPALPDSTSNSFLSLINALLVKDPAQRIEWTELCEHSFWRTKVVSVSLPAQPAFNNMVQVLHKPYLSDRNGEKISQSRTPQKRQESKMRAHKQDESSHSGNKAIETPVRNAQNNRKNNLKHCGKLDTAKGLNLVRMSRMAKLNLQRENEKENYRRPTAETCDDDAEVKIENNDMELDFNENPEDEVTDDADGSENSCIISAELQAENTDKKNEEREQNMDPPSIAADDELVDHKKPEQDTSSEHRDVTATPPSVCSRNTQHVKTVAEPATDSDSSGSSTKLFEVFWHPSDLAVKPVMPSRKGDRAADAIPNLPFESFSPSDYGKLPAEKMNALNGKIIHVLNGSSHVLEKQNIIRYLEILSGNSDAANIIINGPVMLSLIKMLRLSKISTLRVQIASAMGLLIRHCTFIETELANSGIINSLMDGLRDKHDKVRRFSMAALGELLFYISTKNEHNCNDGDTVESPSKEIKATSCWQVTSSVIALVSSILRMGEDDIAQLYALRTIENICSQGGDWASRFASQDVIANLCYIYKATGKHENTRFIAGSCLVRLSRFCSSCIQYVLEKLPLRDVASALVKGNPREQQISLNLLNMSILSMQGLTNMNRNLHSLGEEKHLVPVLLSLIEQGTEILRGKAVMFVALLCINSRRWLSQFLGNVKLLYAVDRLGKEKDGFIQQCMESFVCLIVTTIPGILETVSVDMQQMMAGKRHGPTVALASRGNPKSSANVLPVILHLLGSSSFKHRVVNNHVLLQLTNLIKLLEIPFQGREDFQITLLRVLETIIEDPSVILDGPTIFTGRILPSLAIIYNGNRDGDARFLCLKILFDAMVDIFDDPSLYNMEQILEDIKLISRTYFLPLYPALIEDEDPIPMYAQKLLVMLIEFNYIRVSDIVDLKAVTRCFGFLHGDLSNANVNDVKLCLALASASETETKLLSQLRVARKIGNLLEFVSAKEMEDFLEPTLQLCKAFILRGIGHEKGVALCKEPSLLCNNAFNMSIAVDQQHCIKDVCDFASNLSVFLDLLRNPKASVVDLSSECVVLLLKAAPREATTGILTKLQKISKLMEFLVNNAFGIHILRLLYALAFSCRQYLSHALILSIPASAISSIETLLLTLKNSAIPGIHEAVVNLTLELQRLPRRL
ncbi:serine/threonine-protein kinase RUNKEL-like [Zingiber officinale]|uniref:serine/threonine-protein kinase RUNKEL-like n=1 Tax=Zingiber officinale TaxID=94328 RepID=UPI001C4CC64C|nr:serine/threonine-protein kinase RUNKEL-like [Zingiber officinale]